MMYNKPGTRVGCTKTMPPMHLTRGLVEHPCISPQFRPHMDEEFVGNNICHADYQLKR